LGETEVTALLEVEHLVKHFVADRSVFGRPRPLSSRRSMA